MVAALYVGKNSMYYTLRGVDCWDEIRDARRYSGPDPCVCHPPCRLWGRLRGLSTAPLEELALGVHALETAMRYGGVVEHPAGSMLFRDWASALLNEQTYIIQVHARWFGAPYEALTELFISGIKKEHLPPIHFRLGYPTHVISTRNKHTHRLPEIKGKTAARAATSLHMAQYLIIIAARCKPRS
jgi:hypothetical protein